ncbi:MAG: AMP nucleosidase, partial [Flavobacteriaceae bacterium]
MGDSFTTPQPQEPRQFNSAADAVQCLIELYDRNTQFLSAAFADYLEGKLAGNKFRAYYPEIRFRNTTFARVDSRLSYGHVNQPGLYTTTITQPRLFKGYLTHQLKLLIDNHDQPIEIAESDVAIPLHFALESNSSLAVKSPQTFTTSLRDAFDVPDIAQV